VKISSYKITTMGLLMALSIILTRIASLRIAIGGVEGVRIGIGKLPVILGGIIFGPLSGGLIGALSDIIGYFINPIGAYMPHFTLTSALTGVIPAMVLRILQREYEPKVLELGIAVSSGHVIISLIMIPYFLNSLFEIPWTILMSARIIAAPINILIYVYMIRMMLKRNLFNPALVK